MENKGRSEAAGYQPQVNRFFSNHHLSIERFDTKPDKLVAPSEFEESKGEGSLPNSEDIENISDR